MSTESEELDGDANWTGFPGGYARLPRLSHPKSRSGEPGVAYLKSPNRKARSADPAPSTESGFQQYYTSNSLFEATADAPPEEAEDGPYSVLGLPTSASWEDVSKAHRALVSQLHPDRYVNADEDLRAAAEDRVRDVNEAFATIRREHAAR